LPSYRILYHHRIRADDGQAVHVRELIGALRRLGHDVLECALVPKACAVTAADGAGGERAGRGAVWQRLHLPRRATELLEIAYDRRGAQRLLRAARRFRPHWVYERHALHCASGWRAAQALALPLMLEVNSPMCDEMARLGMLRYARRARRIERRVLAAADAVLPVTDVLRQRLVQCGARAERCWVIGNGAQPERFDGEARRAGRALRAELPGDAFVLGFVGYMRAWHRLEMALEVMRRPGFERVHLMLVGDGPALAPLRQRADLLRVAGRVHTMGVVPPERLAAHLCAFDAGLIPAINDYASPLKLFDTLAAGVVTVAPDQANLRERIDDGVNGLLFAPGSVDDLAAKLAPIVADPQRARAIGEAGRRTLIERDWTWTGNARRVVQVYEDLVS
jgi:glycosyltransferase involved in cell wall biosynthesis